MGDERLALFRGQREKQPGSEAGEDAGNEGGEDDPGERVQAVGMLARASSLTMRERTDLALMICYIA